jgi:hypothetical protein
MAFYELIPESSGILQCKNKQRCSLVMMSMPDYLVSLPLLKSLWENIMQDCSQETSKQTKKLCLENIVKLYLRVRSFSYAKDYIGNFKMQQKVVKSKSLRKELKRKNENNK